MTPDHLNKQSQRFTAAYRADGEVEGVALPAGAIKAVGRSYNAFWAKRGKVVPSERWTSRSRPRGERGVA